MSSSDTLLFPVFNDLRRNGVPLGVSEYLLAIEALQAGFGLEDIDQLKRLCSLLWTKSKADQELLDIAFNKNIAPQFRLTERSPTDYSPTHHPPEPSYDPGLNKPILEPLQLKSQAHPVVLDPLPVLPPSRDKYRKPFKEYHLTPQLPFDLREMTSVWRQLRLMQRVGPAEELDVEATINQICRQRLFLKPVLRPRRRNQVGVVFLIDCEGSMAPFATLVNSLVDCALRAGLAGRITPYYFHDCPGSILYQQPNSTGVISLKDVLARRIQGNRVLIISDAGAARGNYDRSRLKATRVFLKQLSQYTYHYAWLNILPQKRWHGTTAEDIALLVPMFSLSRDGLQDAVNILRGHPFPPGVNLDAQLD